ncbi:MAG: FKBP-type peptidyl-prolyl cis-trans isomerase [Verrucomicrobia bacterium]|nr:FKBP-type peptidyl-prolyl cis-trans isomerase [Verrucomicrobiota bacterium]
MKSLVKPFLSLVVLSVCAAPVLRAQREKIPPEALEFVEKTWPEAKKTNTGIRYIVLKEGAGPVGKAGDRAQVLYVGRLLNGTIFDQTTERDKAFKLRIGRGEVIRGWDQILQQMKVGEKRLVIIPPELAYGTRGQPPKIGRNETLVFEMELTELAKD